MNIYVFAQNIYKDIQRHVDLKDIFHVPKKDQLLQLLKENLGNEKFLNEHVEKHVYLCRYRFRRYIWFLIVLLFVSTILIYLRYFFIPKIELANNELVESKRLEEQWNSSKIN